MKKSRFLAALTALFLIVYLPSCGETPNEEGTGTVDIPLADTSSMDFTYTGRDTQPDYDASSATRINYDGTTVTVTGDGADAEGGNTVIRAEGTYLLCGTGVGQVTVDAAETDKIQLVLDGLCLTSTDGPAICILSADKVFLTTAEESVNALSDTTLYTSASEEVTPDAAVFSRCDLTVNGNGALTVDGNYKHGIVSKDDLVITGGNLTVSAENVALCGKNCVKIGGGSLRLTAGTDGIRSDDTENAAHGYVYISGGELQITAEHDAIQAVTVLKIDGGTLSLSCGGGSANASSSSSSSGGWNPLWGYSDSSSSTVSMKGLKAASDILIGGGEISVDSADDCLHSNGSVEVTGGNLRLSSGDDGIHADTALAIRAGTVSITKSYEGLESAKIVIEGGNISLVASDDGVNAAGGNDSSSVSGRPGQGGFSSSTGSVLIAGGYLCVNAAGDGLDSNGTLTVIGGTTLVSGPTDSGNGALDYDSTATISGGVLIAVGSSGMAQNFSSAEGQGAILCSFSSQSAGTPLSLCDASGRVIVSYTPPKAYQCAVISAPGIQSGNTYTLMAGGTVSGADENLLAADTTLTGGTTLSTVSMTSNLYGTSGGGMGGSPGGGGRPGGRP